MYLILLFLPITVNALHINSTVCPEVKAVDNFNFTAFAQGTWYEIGRYPNDFEESGNCMLVKFNLQNGTYYFTVTGISESGPILYNGYILHENPINNTGTIRYVMTSTEIEGGTYVINWILDIDYDKYAIFFGCKYNAKDKFYYEDVWIVSRFKKPDEEVKSAIDKFFKSSALFVESSKFIWDNFEDEKCLA